MEKGELTQNLIDKFGESEIIDSIIEKHLKLAFTLMLHKKINREEDYVGYTESYNKVCEDIAKTISSIDQLEYLFNAYDINQHYDNITEELEKSVKD